MQFQQLEVILKTVERCNIACSYCYFFFGGDDSYLRHPPVISIDTITKLVPFLRDGCKSCGCEVLQIDFHGGEPMLQKKKDFDKMCEILQEGLPDLKELRFAIQTNGMLIDDEWIALFEKYNVGVGVSIDGPENVNDKYRVDKKGKGTYQRVLQGIKKLEIAKSEGKIREYGSLAVINPEFSAKQIYRHIVDTVNIKQMDFLLPDFIHSSFDVHSQKTGIVADDYGQFLCELFDEWVIDDDPSVYVRILHSTMSLLMGKNSSLTSFGPLSRKKFAFTIASNGDIFPDDTFRILDPSFTIPHMNIAKNSLNEFLNCQTLQTLIEENKKIPNGCSECCWKNICRGGSLIHRYNNNGFDNPSLLCSGLKKLYSHVTNYLLKNEISIETVQFNLGIE